MPFRDIFFDDCYPSQGRLIGNSNAAKNSPGHNGEIRVNCQCISHFVAENGNKKRIKSHNLLVSGQPGSGENAVINRAKP